MAKDQKGTPGYLPISDAMARDLDAGRADNRALDDFLPDSTLQELKDQQDAQKVVHGEDLIPISRAEAARRTTFDGDTMPSLPKARRVIPAPYRRDRVVGGKHGKKWQEVPAEQVKVRDILFGQGVVTRTRHEVRYEEGHVEGYAHIHEDDGTVEGCPGCFAPAVGVDIQVWSGLDNYTVLDSQATVRVFR